MNDVWEIIWALAFGAIFGAFLAGGCVDTHHRKDSVRSGHAEYYIDTNDFAKRWRWKEIK